MNWIKAKIKRLLAPTLQFVGLGECDNYESLCAYKVEPPDKPMVLPLYLKTEETTCIGRKKRISQTRSGGSKK